MDNHNFIIIKSSGEEEPFSVDKYITSLHRIGLDTNEAKLVFTNTLARIYDKISTSKLYGITFNEIKKLSPRHASIYSLKESLRQLGPSGFPFEHLISELFIQQGYDIKLDQHIKGQCAVHEIDVIATLLPISSANGNNIVQSHGKTTLVEVKFHVEFGHKSDIKIPLYVKARFDDIKNAKNYDIENYTIATNTKFTINAISYSVCAGISLLAWGYPKHNSIQYLIDRYKLYPITVLHSLSDEEKQTLIYHNIVLFQDLALARMKALIPESKLEDAYQEYLILRT